MSWRRWRPRGFEPLLDRWIRENNPSDALQTVVIHWMMDLCQNPMPVGAARVPGVASNLWLADIPGTTLSFLYVVDEPAHELVGVLLEPQ